MFNFAYYTDTDNRDMNYRFLSSITDAEVADFRNRLAAELATRMTGDGKRVISDEAIGQEVNLNISTEDAKKYLQSNDAENYDYAQLADVIAAKYRTFSSEDIEATRKAMVDKFMELADEYGWEKEQARRDAEKEFYDNLADGTIIELLRNGESITDYVEYVSIYD